MGQKSFAYQKEQTWQLVLGIDLSSTSMKYLMMRRRMGSLVVEAYGKFSISDQEYDLSAKIEEVFSTVLPKSLWKKAKIVIGFDSSRLVLRRESFPKMASGDMKQAVEMGLAQQFESEGGDSSVICDLIQAGPDTDTPGNTQYVVFGMPESDIFTRLQPFTQNHIIPHKVLPSIITFSNLLQFLPEESRQGHAAILDMGADSSVLVFFRDGMVDFKREIAVGGDDFTKSVTGTIFHEGRAIQFSSDEAAEFKQRYGYPLGFSDGMTFRGAPLTEVGAMMRPVVERLSGEIHRSLVFYKENTGGAEVTSLFLLGGGSRLKHITEVLSENLSIPVETMPFPDNIRVAGSTQDRECFESHFLEQAVSFSAALEETTEKNLLPQALQKVHKNAAVQKIMAYAACAVVAVLLLVTNGVKNKNANLAKRVASIEVRVQKSPSRGDEFARLQTKQQNLEQRYSDLSVKTGQDSSVAQLLKLISNTIPSNLKLISLDMGKEETKQQNTSRRSRAAQQEEPAVPRTVVTMSGWSKNPPNDIGVFLAKFVVELEKSGFFDEVVVNEEEYLEEENSYAFRLSAYIAQ